MASERSMPREQIVILLRQIEVAIATGKTSQAACKDGGSRSRPITLVQRIRCPEGGSGQAAMKDLLPGSTRQANAAARVFRRLVIHVSRPSVYKEIA
jgi:hypothetical protein